MGFSVPRKSSKMPDFSRQKCEKCAFFLSFFAKMMHTPTGFALKLRKNGVTTPDMAARKRVYKGGCHPGKPANLYSTKCRFFAASPYRGSQCTECTPSGESSRPRLDHTGEGSPTPPAKNFFKIFLKIFFYNLKKIF